MANNEVTEQDRINAKALFNEMHAALATAVAVMDKGRQHGLMVQFTIAPDPDPAKPSNVTVTVQKIVTL